MQAVYRDPTWGRLGRPDELRVDVRPVQLHPTDVTVAVLHPVEVSAFHDTRHAFAAHHLAAGLSALSDLVVLFGPIEELGVVEIGGGYGGQCFVASTVGFQSWMLIDLAPVLQLARRYLDRLGVEHVEFVDYTALRTNVSADLVVSNYAFSECTRRVQRVYLDQVISRCGRGYMTCNFMEGMGREEIAAAVPGSRWLNELPLSGKGNAILVWGDG